MIIPYLTNANQYLPLFNCYLPIFNWCLQATLTGPYLYLNNSYRLVILRQTLLEKSMVLKFTIHWIVLKFWAQTRKLRDNQDSKIAYSINGSWYFKKTNVDGKWYIFRNIYFVIFIWFGVKCCIDECRIVYIIKALFW